MPYSDPFRLRVLKALTDSLKQITPANGYQHDLSAGVFRGRELFGENDPIPMVSILEAVDEFDQSMSPRGGEGSSGPWPLLIQGFVDDDLENPTDPAHHLMAEVKRQLVVERQRARDYRDGILGLAGQVDALNFSAGVVRPPDGISGKAYFWLRVDLTLVEDLLNPYE